MIVELRDGRIFMEINYGPEKQLAFLTSNTYNGGVWVKVEAARALRNNVGNYKIKIIQKWNKYAYSNSFSNLQKLGCYE